MVLTVGLIIDKIKEQLNKAAYLATEIRAITHILFKHFCGLEPAQLYVNLDRGIEPEIAAQIVAALQRLENYEPLQYILGETEFYGLLFTVDKNVLIPRPETEELVHWIINDYKGFEQTPFTILDIGTGSGAIAVSLAKNLTRALVYALDISAGALNVAAKNATLNNVEVRFIQQDILSENIDLPVKFDCIVSNPPYVRNSEKQLMHTNVLDYEPHTALFVDDNNALVFYNAVARVAKQYLKANGSVYVEINEALPDETQELFRNYGFKTDVRKDINDKPRMIKALRL